MRVKDMFALPVVVAVVVICAGVSRAQTSYTGALQVSGAEFESEQCTAHTCFPAWVTGNVGVTVNGSGVSASYGQGSTGDSVASALCSQMSGSFPVKCAGVNVVNGYPTLALEASANVTISTSCVIVSPNEAVGNCAFRALPVVSPKVRPTALLLSILYDPPGIGSSNGYSDSTTYGTTTTIGSSFQAGTTTTFQETTGFPGFQSTVGWSFGFSTVSGNSSAFTWSASQGKGVANSHRGTSNAVNHAQNDLFVVWINPEVTLTQPWVRTFKGNTQEYNAAKAADYSISTPLQEAGQPNPGQPHTQDIVQVYANELADPSLISPNILQPITLVTGETLPGLAATCKNQQYYPNKCSQDPNHACGCVASDFAAILAADPVLNFSRSQSPTTVNNPPSNIRYDLTNSAELLEGPPTPGGNNPPNTFTASDSSQTVDTTTNGYSYSTGLSVGFTFGNVTTLGWSLQVTNTDTFTWTNTESIGTINGQMHQMQVTLTSPTVGCTEYTGIYIDTVYHTFDIQENATEDSTCP
jgi:hypothetical protein